MKILNHQQIRELDAFSIKEEGIPSLELMERAGASFCNWFKETFPERDYPIYLFCGPGNNGGDGLVVARLLFNQGYRITVIRLENEKYSNEAVYQFEKIKSIKSLSAITVTHPKSLKWDLEGSIIIDAY